MLMPTLTGMTGGFGEKNKKERKNYEHAFASTHPIFCILRWKRKNSDTQFTFDLCHVLN